MLRTVGTVGLTTSDDAVGVAWTIQMRLKNVLRNIEDKPSEKSAVPALCGGKSKDVRMIREGKRTDAKIMETLEKPRGVDWKATGSAIVAHAPLWMGTRGVGWRGKRQAYHCTWRAS